MFNKNIPSSHCCNALMHCSSKKQYLCLCMYVYIYIYMCLFICVKIYLQIMTSWLSLMQLMRCDCTRSPGKHQAAVGVIWISGTGMLIAMKAKQARAGWSANYSRKKTFSQLGLWKKNPQAESFFFSRSDRGLATTMKDTNKTVQPLDCFFAIVHPKRMQMGSPRRNVN